MIAWIARLFAPMPPLEGDLEGARELGGCPFVAGLLSGLVMSTSYAPEDDS